MEMPLLGALEAIDLTTTTFSCYCYYR